MSRTIYIGMGVTKDQEYPGIKWRVRAFATEQQANEWAAKATARQAEIKAWRASEYLKEGHGDYFSVFPRNEHDVKDWTGYSPVYYVRPIEFEEG